MATVNTNLTNQNIYDILVATADKLLYNPNGLTQGQLNGSTPFTVGYRYDNSGDFNDPDLDWIMGYGRVNMLNAVMNSAGLNVNGYTVSNNLMHHHVVVSDINDHAYLVPLGFGAYDREMEYDATLNQSGCLITFDGTGNTGVNDVGFEIEENATLHIRNGATLRMENDAHFITNPGTGGEITKIMVLNGGTFDLSGDDFVLPPNTLLEVMNGGVLLIGDDGRLELQADATLLVRTGGELTISNNGQIEALANSFLCIEQGATLRLQHATSWLIIQANAQAGVEPNLTAPIVGATNCQPFCDLLLSYTGQGAIFSYANNDPTCCLPTFDIQSGDILLDNVTTASLGIPGYLNVTNNDILINGTLTVNSDFYFNYCPNVYLNPDAQIIVTGDHLLTIQSSTFQAACNTMWRKIEADGSLNRVYIFNSVIRDADTALVSLNCGDIQTSQNTFLRDNHMHAYINDCSTWPGSFIQTTFETDNQFTISPLLYPYWGGITFRGVQVNDIDQIYIGSNNQQAYKNLFDHWRDAAIYCENSNIYIRNNEFSNNAGAYAGQPNFGVHAASVNGSQQAVVGGSLTYDPNYFHDINNNIGNAILAENGYQLHAEANIIEDVDHGVRARNCGNDITIINNQISRAYRGVWCNGNTNTATTSIEKNTILNDPPNMINSQYGIWVQENTGSANIVGILDNTVSGSQFGIKAENCQDMTIDNNAVTLRDLAPAVTCGGNPFTATYVGIWADYCDRPSIIFNTVTNTATSRACFHGIGVRHGTEATVCNNDVSDLENGIWFWGSTLSPSTIGLNTMTDVDNGFAMTNNGEIGPQGGSGDPRGNRWVNHTWATNYVNSNASGTANFWWTGGPLSTANPIPNTFVGFNPNVPQNTTGTEDCIDGVQKTGGAGSNVNLRQQRVEWIASDTTTYPEYSPETHWWNRWTALGFIHDRYSAIDTTVPAISNFIQAQRQKTLWKLFEIDRLVAGVLADRSVSANDRLKLLAALNINRSVIPGLAPEVCKKAVNELYLKELLGVITAYDSAQLSVLTAMANRCPFEAGPAVYQARVMLAKLDITDFKDNCIAGGQHPRSKAAEEDMEVPNFRIYPNPASDKLMIENQFSKDSRLEFIVKDVTGKLLIKRSFTGSFTEQLDVSSFATGIYVYQLHLNGVREEAGKIAIAR